MKSKIDFLMVEKILEGKTTGEIAEELNVSPTKVTATRRKIKVDDVNKEINNLMSGVETPEEAVMNIKEKTHVDIKKDQIKGIQKLDALFQNVFTQSLNVAKQKLLASDLTVKEWAIITKTSADMYQAIFNKNNTNINIINGNNQQVQMNEKLNIFKTKMGV